MQGQDRIQGHRGRHHEERAALPPAPSAWTAAPGSSASASFPDRTLSPISMALDLGLTTYQLLSTLDSVALDIQTRSRRLDEAIDRALTISTDEATSRTAAVGRRPYISRPHGPRGPAGQPAAAHRMNRLYMSYCLVFCAPLEATYVSLMRRSISGYSRFLLLSFCWLALYGGLPMITLIGLLVLLLDAEPVLFRHGHPGST